MTNAPIAHTGGCRCGAVRFTASAEPHYTAICHCVDCRRASGAPFLAFVGFYRSQLSFVGDTGQRYGEGDVTRSFCPTCGAPIAYEDGRLADRIYVYLGAMDEPARFAPRLQAFAGEALPFAAITVDLPGHAAMSVRRP
ncbi:GFA family protein [Jiella sp. MQZ9-1]|uniref:GFA family protein n=1 Tax=Jiella flava TaxID=2816857 RepID=A0A939FV02_9HYPH|nr:GFA family protein [Jiella flava]MBO0661344.1 GFA family protein [Jiella flava]MCD2469989.1 GFA family protein [Jiella flava]